jgi:hypothetical protein
MSDRTVSYTELLDRYQQLAGVVTMDTAQLAAANAFLNRNIKAGWEAYEWPWNTEIESRTVDSSTNVIAYTQASQTPIGEVFAVFKYDPFSSNGPQQLPYNLTADGIQFYETGAPTSAYVYYRTRVPAYTGDDWDSATTFAIGDVVRYSTDGEYYEAIDSGTNDLPTDTAVWELLTIPYDLMEYVTTASAGDLLLANGQYDRGRALRNDAKEMLYDEIEKYSRQQNHRTLRRTFYTHGTEQLRNY